MSGQPATLCLVNSGNVSVFIKFLIRRDEFCHDNSIGSWMWWVGGSEYLPLSSAIALKILTVCFLRSVKAESLDFATDGIRMTDPLSCWLALELEILDGDQLIYTDCRFDFKIKIAGMSIFFIFNVGTPCGVHLFDHHQWSIFQSSITHYIIQFLQVLLCSMICCRSDVQWGMYIL